MTPWINASSPKVLKLKSSFWSQQICLHCMQECFCNLGKLFQSSFWISYFYIIKNSRRECSERVQVRIYFISHGFARKIHFFCDNIIDNTCTSCLNVKISPLVFNLGFQNHFHDFRCRYGVITFWRASNSKRKHHEPISTADVMKRQIGCVLRVPAL